MSLSTMLNNYSRKRSAWFPKVSRPTPQAAEQVLAKLDDAAPCDLEVLMSMGTVNNRWYVAIGSNPFGHVAVRIDKTIYTINGFAIRGQDDKIIQDLSLTHYLYGMEQPTPNSFQGDSYGNSFIQGARSIRVKGITAEQKASMLQYIASLNAKFNETDFEYKVAQFNCSNFVVELLTRGKVIPRRLPLRLQLLKHEPIKFPLDTFRLAEALFALDPERFQPVTVEYPHIRFGRRMIDGLKYPVSLFSPLSLLRAITRPHRAHEHLPPCDHVVRFDAATCTLSLDAPRHGAGKLPVPSHLRSALGRWRNVAALLALLSLSSCATLVVDVGGSFLPGIIASAEQQAKGPPPNPAKALEAGRSNIMYAAAYVAGPAERLPSEAVDEKKAEQNRAIALYQRGRDEVLTALDAAHPGFVAAWTGLDDAAWQAVLAQLTTADVAAAYWCVAGQLGAFSLSPYTVELSYRVPKALALLERAYALNPQFQTATLDELMVTVYASLPDSLGGNRELAKTHFDLAQAKTGGRATGAYLAWAMGVDVPTQNKAEFVELLGKVLAVDANANSETSLSVALDQKRARWLQGRLDDLFIE